MSIPFIPYDPVHRILSSLNVRKTSILDSILPFVLRKYASELVNVLVQLYNFTFNALLPKTFVNAGKDHMSSRFRKQGNGFNLSNYRLIIQILFCLKSLNLFLTLLS